MTLNWPQFYRLSGDYLEMLIAALAEADRDIEKARKLLKAGTKKRKFLIGNNAVWTKQMREIITSVKKEKKVRPPETMRACQGGMVGPDNVKGVVKDLMAYELAIYLRHGDLPGRPGIVNAVMEAKDIEKIRFV